MVYLRAAGAGALVLAVGCGPSVVLPGDDGGAEGTTGERPPPPPPPTTGPPPPTSVGDADATTLPPDSSTGEPDSTGSSTSTGEPVECEPLPTEADLVMYIEYQDAYDDKEYVDVDASCTVTDVEGFRGDKVVQFGCPDDTFHRIEFSTSLAIDIAALLPVDTPVQLRLLRLFPIDYGGWEYITIRDAEGDLLAAKYGYGTPYEGDDPATLFAPLTWTGVDGLCPIDVYEEPKGGFIMDPCPEDIERIAVDFDDGTDQVRIHDGNEASVGPLSLFVSATRRYPVEEWCGTADPYDSISFTAVRS